jgi:hypothetical protein
VCVSYVNINNVTTVGHGGAALDPRDVREFHAAREKGLEQLVRFS